MSGQALALVLCGALIHALWNYFAKKAAGGPPFVWLYGIVSLVPAGPIGYWVWSYDPHPIGPAGWALMVVSAVVHLIYSVLLQHGYRVADFSVVYPVARGSGPLFSVLAAVVLLGEMPTPLGALGILMIVAGAVAIAGMGDALKAGRLSDGRGVGWGLATGVFIAIYTIVDGWAVKGLGLPPIPYYVLSLGMRTVLLAPLVLGRRRDLVHQVRANAVPIAVVGVLAPFSYVLVLYAMTLAPISYVAPARELSMMLGTLAGMRLLQEEQTLGRLAGVALMAGGVALLNLGG